MKKNRILCIMLALLSASAAAFTACGDSSVGEGSGSEQNTEPVTEAVTEEKIPYELLEQKDLGGAVFTILDANQYASMHINIPEDKTNGELVNDALIDRNLAVEDRFNIDIQYIQESTTDSLKSAVMAGEDAYQLVFTAMNRLSVLATGQLLYNLCDMPDLTLDAPWWSPLMAESLKLNGGMFFTAGDIAPAVYQSPCCMFLNLKLYNDYDIGEDIYGLVLDGKWTLDALERITKGLDNDVNGDGKFDDKNDFYGIAVLPTEETTEAFLAATEAPVCSFTSDKTGIVLDVTSNERALEVLDRLGATAKKINYSTLNNIITSCFKEDRALFLQHKLESAHTHLRDMESDYLVLPDPKFDEAQKTYRSCVSIFVSGFVAVPATAEPGFSGFVTEALARYSNAYIRPKTYEMVYKDKLSRDPRSVEVLDVLFDNLYVDFSLVFNFGKIYNNIANSVFGITGTPIVSMVESIRGTVESEIQTVVDTWKSAE